MTKKDVQFVVLICQFHFFAKAKYKDCFRKDLVDKIRSLEDISVLLEVLGSSTLPHVLDDGVDILSQIDIKILKEYLTTLNDDHNTNCLYIVIRAAGKHRNNDVLKKEILDRMYSSYDDVREAVAEALCDMGDIENLKQMSKKDQSKFIRELAEELLEDNPLGIKS